MKPCHRTACDSFAVVNATPVIAPRALMAVASLEFTPSVPKSSRVAIPPCGYRKRMVLVRFQFRALPAVSFTPASLTSALLLPKALRASVRCDGLMTSAGLQIVEHDARIQCIDEAADKA